MSSRRLEIKVIKGQGSDPETFEIPLEKAGKFTLFVFRNPSMSDREINDLVEISKRASGEPCGALILSKDDSFEVYEIEIPTRYEREPVI
jgi:hypothetical protein